MPAGSEWKRGCWARTTKLEKILIGVVLATGLIIIILIILLAKTHTKPQSETCNSNACLIEASKIAQYVNPDVNPCENFYQFACGKFLENAHGDEKLELMNRLKEKRKWELIEAYTEPIGNEDHKMVKTVKRLFDACMDMPEIRRDNLRTIKKALNVLEGWPVVETTHWNATNFDWLNVTYKLRELGYYYKIFLELSVERDPGNDTQFIYKVATPSMWDYSSYNFDKIKFMTDVAIRFGAPQYDQSVVESMRSADEFLTQLQKETHARYLTNVYRKLSVEQFQKLYGAVDWLQFINRIGGPGSSISKTDLVLFPQPEVLRNWINIITRTPKRIQANYMIWKVIEKSIPFLTSDLQNPNLQANRDEAREDFCLREIQERFIPSPVEIVCDRKYLPMEKKEKVEELVGNIKSQLAKAVENAEWMEASDKQKTVEKVKTMKVIIGHLDDYFEDKILDELGVDMMEVKSETLLNLIAQANRNHQTMIYNQIKKPRSFYNKWYGRRSLDLPYYDENENVFFIPRTITEDAFFNENRPHYINYAVMGTILGQQLSVMLVGGLRTHALEPWTNQTKQEVENKFKCLKEKTQDYGFGEEQVTSIMPILVGGELSYRAYEEWLKNNKEEIKLIQTEYSPKQLFWIASTSSSCQPIHKYGNIWKRTYQDDQVVGNVFSASLRNHPQLAEDFKCAAGAKMNPASRCMIF